MRFSYSRVLFLSVPCFLLLTIVMLQTSAAQDSVLIDQVDDYSGFFIAMQNSDSDAASTTTADDFTVPQGVSWTIRSVFIDGSYVVSPNNPDGDPQCSTATVGFWDNATDRPGQSVVVHENVAVASDVDGDLTLTIQDTVLEAGTYWLAIQCAGNLGTNQNGARLFYWERNDNAGLNSSLGFVAVSTNPGGDLQWPASGWNSLFEIGQYENGLDMSFRLSGSMSASTNTEDEAIPSSLSLDAPYPNPFSDSFSVNYYIDQPTEVEIVVYDAVGRVHATLTSGFKSSGTHEASLDGSALRNGLYFVRMTTASGQSQVKGVTLSR